MKTKRVRKTKSKALVLYVAQPEPRRRPLVSLDADGTWTAIFRGELGRGYTPGAALEAIGYSEAI